MPGLVKDYSLVRMTIEWDYGNTVNKFGYFSNYNKLRILGSRNVVQVYTVATILRNCLVGLYGCEVPAYYGLTIEGNFLERDMGGY